MKLTLTLAAGLLALSLTSGGWCAPPTSVGGAAPGPRAGQVAERRQTLLVSPVRVLGGIDRKDPLPGRLGRGLAEFVGEKLGRETQILSDRMKPGKGSGATVFSLESDLTRVGSVAGSATFLWTVRLYREGRERTLEAHWAGSASGVGELESNLKQVPGLHGEGLLGELGERIASVLKDDRADRLTDRFRQVAMKNFARRGEERVAVHVEGAEPQQGQDGTFAIPTGSPYALSLTPGAGRGRLVVLRFDGGDGPDGKLTIVPGGAVPGTLGPGEREHRYLVLFKADEEIPAAARAGKTPAPPAPSRVLGGALNGERGELAALLQELESAAPGSWSAQAVTIRAVPRPEDRLDPGGPAPRPIGKGADAPPPAPRKWVVE